MKATLLEAARHISLQSGQAKPKCLAEGISDWRVVDGEGQPHGEQRDQVSVRSCVDEVAMSGVLTTRDSDTGADYVVVHYDDRIGRTDSMTSGPMANARVVRILRNRERLPEDPTLNALLRTVQELESIHGSDALEVEFAFTRDGQLHVLQVEPIAATGRWRPLDRRAQAQELRGIRAFLDQRMRPWPGVRGRTTILGQTPDWNPAEMIGSFPKPLARSLCELLITDHAGRLGRAAIGYADPFPHPLMVEIAGRPYVDLRLSANNLLPARMDADLRERVVDAGLRRLERRPELHEEVEFEVFPTAWNFDLDRTLDNLVEHGLPREDLPACRRALLDHTRELLRRGRDIMEGQLARTETLQQQTSALFDEEPGDDLLARIAEVLALTVRDGTFPFAVLARLAFVGTSLLRSLGACGALEPEEITEFVGDVRTVSTEMVDMLERVRSGEVSRDDFLARFGHLRPSSYDLLSCRYDLDPGLYLPPVERGEGDGAKITSKAAQPAIGPDSRARIDALLTDHGLGIDARELLGFVAEAIRARELAKFRFTFSLSGVLEWLAEFGDRHGLDREDVAHLDIHRLLDLTRGPLPCDLDEKLSQEVLRAKERRDLVSAILLPGLIFGSQDVDIVREPATRPNFVTSRSVTAPVVRVGSAGDDGTNADGVDLEGRVVVVESVTLDCGEQRIHGLD